jgi:SAM-dependent methyltransferase
MKSDPFYAFVATVIKLGRTPKGYVRTGRRADAIFKTIFKGVKPTILEIWEIYTQRRDDLTRRLVSNKESVVAYLLGFHLANMARASVLYERSDARHGWKKLIKNKKVRVYDIGCGSGAMSLALGLTDADYFMIDGSGPLLEAAAMLAEEMELRAKTTRRVVEELDPKQFATREGEDTVHIYLFGYVWNELTRNNPARRKLMTLITKHIERKEQCLIFIAEPALEQMSRPTMELRDVICSSGYVALYPCPHSDHCPMLDRPKDWCYSEGEWDQPPLARWVDEHLDMNRSRHAGSLFAFASPALGLTSDPARIVVGRPVREEGKERYKGFYDYLICDEDGISKVTPTAPLQVISRGMILNETPEISLNKPKITKPSKADRNEKTGGIEKTKTTEKTDKNEKAVIGKKLKPTVKNDLPIKTNRFDKTNEGSSPNKKKYQPASKPRK